MKLNNRFIAIIWEDYRVWRNTSKVRKIYASLT